jgi:MarR family 2-MHQ and catechol resistance regulon transcriptional repressor
MNTVAKIVSEPSALRLETVLNELIVAFNLRRQAVLQEYNVQESDVEIIRYLSREENKKMKEVGEFFHIKLSTLTSTIDKLEKNKLVKRKSSRDDRRVIYIQVSSRGQSLLQELAEPAQTAAQGCVSQFSAPECDAVARALEFILTGLKPA